MLLDAIVSVGSLIAPPVFDFIKKKFLKPSQDTPQATISSLATTKPEVIPQYVEAQSKLIEANIKYHNRDVVGELSKWVIDLRGAIRPTFVIWSLLLISISVWWKLDMPQAYKILIESCVSSWFGSRMIK